MANTRNLVSDEFIQAGLSSTENIQQFAPKSDDEDMRGQDFATKKSFGAKIWIFFAVLLAISLFGSRRAE